MSGGEALDHGYLSQALALAYVAVSCGILVLLRRRGGPLRSNFPRADRILPWIYGAGAVVATAGAALETYRWIVHGPMPLEHPELAQTPAAGYVIDYAFFWYLAATLVLFATLFLRHARGRPSGWRRLVAGNALVLLALLGVAAAIGETYYRYVFDTVMSQGDSLTNRSWLLRHWRPGLNRFEFRDGEWSQEKAPGSTRVVFLGDSIAAGYGINDPADRYGDIVARELERRAPGAFEVWNAGVVGWSTADEEQWLGRALPGGGVDRVILAYCLNDAADLTPRAAEQAVRASLARPAWIDPRQSFLFDTLWTILRLRQQSDRLAAALEGEVDAHRDAAVWERQRERMRRLAERCRENGVRLDVVLFPDLSQWGADYPAADVHERLRAAWTDLGARVLDLRDAYAGMRREDLVVNGYDPHPNELGHALAADAILAAYFAE